MNAPDPSSDGWVGGSSVPQRDDVFSGSDGNHHTTYLISYNELLTQDSQQLHAEKEHNCICITIDMINKRRQLYTQESFLLFSKKKLPWVGYKPTTLCILGERSTN